MKLSLLPQARRLCRFPSLRSGALPALPLLLLNGALVRVAQAQTAGGAQTEVPGGGGFLASLFSGLGALSLLALGVGLISPNSFRFLFKEKTSRKRVGWTLGAAMLFFVTISGSMSPAPRSSATQGSSAPVFGKDQSAVRLAEQRAKAAEARAARAEKAAASANAKANAKSSSDEIEGDSAPKSKAEPKAAPQGEELPSNIEVVDIPGVGKRQAGTVDDVVYVIGKAETTKTLGGDMYRREADGVFYVLQVVANNQAKETHDVTTMLMKLVDDQGREFDPSSEGATALKIAGEKSAEAFSAQLQPGVTKKLTLVYDAPADAKGLKLKIPAGFGFGKDALIRVPTANE